MCLQTYRFKLTETNVSFSQAGSLLIAGMGMFCGSLYHQALTGDPGLRKAAPVGGVAMIVGWLAMIL